MSVLRKKKSKRGSGWKPPRDRREIATAVLASLAVVVVTAALVWFLRPNRDSGSTSTVDVTTPVTVPSDSSTTLPTAPTAPTTLPTTSVPAEPSTP